MDHEMNIGIFIFTMLCAYLGLLLWWQQKMNS